MANIDKQYANLQEQLIKEQNEFSKESSKHESILSEVKNMKRQNKQSRLTKVDLERSLHYEQLARQKLSVKFAVQKQKVHEDASKSDAEKEKDLEK